MILVYVAFALACVGLALQVRDAQRAAAKRRDDQIAECAARGHYWEYRSAYDEGRYWSKHCPQCPLPDISLTIEDVPDDELEAFRRRREAKDAKKRVAGLL